MAAKIFRADYFYATVADRPGEAYRMLARLAASQVNLLAFSAIPLGGERTQLMLFPEKPELLTRMANELGMPLTGPQSALLIRGDDELGALVDIHRRLAEANVNVYASSGVSADCGRFGYVLYVRHEDFARAAAVLGVRGD